jgi:hypothetical protein
VDLRKLGNYIFNFIFNLILSSTKPKLDKNLTRFMTSSPGKSLQIRPWLSRDINLKRNSTPLNLAKLQLGLNSMIISDQINTQIRSSMNFSNLKIRNFTGCIYPGLLLERNAIFPSFPTYLGKIGSINKVKRFTRECKGLFANSSSGKII